MEDSGARHYFLACSTTRYSHILPLVLVPFVIADECVVGDMGAAAEHASALVVEPAAGSDGA
jgi:hypothetical protein